MATLDELTAKLRAAFAKEYAGDKALKFDLGDDGVIRIQGTEVTNTNDPAECVITISRENLEGILSGDADPMETMMSGGMTIDGDFDVAAKLQPIILKAWGGGA